jgi:hypothetical protein
MLKAIIDNAKLIVQELYFSFIKVCGTDDPFYCDEH